MSAPSPEVGFWGGGARNFLRAPAALNRLRLVLTFLTLGILAWYLHSRPRPDLALFRPRWGLLALAASLLPLLLWLRAAKWRLLLLALAPRITLGESLRSYLGSMAMAIVTPGRVGELSRGLYLPHKAVQGWKGAGLVLLDSWTDFVAVVAWACLGWAVVGGPSGLLLGAALAAVLAPVHLWLRLVPKAVSCLPARAGFRAWVARTLPGPADAPSGNLLGAGLLGVIAYGIEWAQLILLLEGLAPVEASPWRVAGVMALVTLANSVQVTLAGLGVREGVTMFLLAREGIDAEAAVMAAFLQSVLLLFLPALAGLAVKPVAAAPVDPAIVQSES